MCLSGKVILVTGGNKGIGAASVKLLHEKGAVIILQYNSDLTSAKKLSEELNNERVHLIQADLSTEVGAKNVWQQSLQLFSKIDVLINCAGTMRPAEIALPYPEWKNKWDFTFQLNVTSLAWLSIKAAEYFSKKDGGIIINLSSRAGYMGSPDVNYLNYAASKGAVMSLTKTIARAYAKNNVLAYVIAPGLVETDMTKDFIEEQGINSITQNIPLGQIAKPSDIGEIIAFLATGKARHATGSTFHINGGSYI